MQQPADLETVRESYDRVADAYVELAMGRLDPEPWLRAVLAAFAESVRGLGPVLDVGCGPGTVTAHLTELGLDGIVGGVLGLAGLSPAQRSALDTCVAKLLNP